MQQADTLHYRVDAAYHDSLHHGLTNLLLGNAYK